MTIGSASAINYRAADSRRREFVKRVKVGDARFDRRSGQVSRPTKKNGAGGKGNWGTWEDDVNDYFEEYPSTVNYTPQATMVTPEKPKERQQFQMTTAFPVSKETVDEFNLELKRVIALLSEGSTQKKLQQEPRKYNPRKQCREHVRHPRSFTREGVRFSQPMPTSRGCH